MAWARSTNNNSGGGFNAQTGALAGSMLGGGIYNLFGGGGANPGDEANKILGGIPGQVSPYLDPYMNAGKSALPGYQDMMAQLMKDPTQFMKMLGQGYQKSPGYDFNLQQGQNAITNANASGGMLGTPQHEQQAGQMATNLASQDYNQYMQNIMKMFGMGAEGTSNVVQGGQKAASSLADMIAQVLGQQAAYKYAGTAGENEKKSSGFGNLLGGIGTIAGSIYGGPAGGAVGGAAGNALGGMF